MGKPKRSIKLNLKMVEYIESELCRLPVMLQGFVALPPDGTYERNRRHENIICTYDAANGMLIKMENRMKTIRFIIDNMYCMNGVEPTGFKVETDEALIDLMEMIIRNPIDDPLKIEMSEMATMIARLVKLSETSWWKLHGNDLMDHLEDLYPFSDIYPLNIGGIIAKMNYRASLPILGKDGSSMRTIDIEEEEEEEPGVDYEFPDDDDMEGDDD